MDVRALKDGAAELFRKGRFSKAAERYGELVKAEPRDPQHLIKLGDSLRRDGKRELAITAYCKAVDMYAQQGVVIKAIAACKLVLELDPEQKAVQEALASLIARRYVRRDHVERLQPSAPEPGHTSPSYMQDAIELPVDDDDEMLLETAGGDSLELDDTRSWIGQEQPVSSLPPLTRHRDLDPLELVDEEVREPPVLVPARQDFDAIEIDFDDVPLDVPVSETIDVVPDLDFIPLDDAPIIADSPSEHRVMLDASDALQQPASAMIDILSDSLLIEGEIEDGEEIELLSITMGEPSVVVDLDPAVVLPTYKAAPATEHAKIDQTRRDDEDDDDAIAPSTDEPESGSSESSETEASEAAAAIAEVEQQRVPLFSELPQEAFLELLEKVAFRRVEEGEVILREGDLGRSIFVLASGRARVVKGHGTDAPIALAVLEDGSFFGEMALLNGAARVASVVAIEDSEILELTEDVLSDLMRRYPPVTHSLKKFYRQRLLSNVMAISPLFKAFDTSERRMLVEKFKLREMKPHEAVISEGGRPDGLYVVMHGACLVTKTAPDGDRQMPLAVLREGDVFGEMSLLSRAPASASVTATRRTLVLRLPKSVFDELMFTHPAVLEVVSELTDQRTHLNEQILSGAIQVAEEVLALL